jgi:preprotein translocase SecE subunit
MKKVNWTSRKELIGSTKVVIGFMFLIAFLLFGLDVIFGYFFQLLTVLKTGPFG